MTEAITGKPVAEVGRIISEFRAMMLDGADANESLLGDGISLEGVRAVSYTHLRAHET